jgi:MarR family 2-MHQ and catechol resistance regulon transcriptional repressor
MAPRSYGKPADLALNVWVKLARAYQTIGRHAGEDIRSHGLTQPQFGVLDVLGHRGPLTLGEIARKRLISGGNTTVIVDHLEALGFVERRPCPDDRRVIYVRLTARGRRLFDTIFPRHAETVARLMSALTEPEQERLAFLLKKLGLSLPQAKAQDHRRSGRA